ncbi:uncharacterized protein PGTG_03521 [Puccinia graminis f. sp. tritici CRL 75-36-700-3]|uniref:Uncharacterized protein n=1 Tax=Puccinia graminis f. sp. tritici (strain CRL 75-36-700-3 / race SCCL) TaxID=418459 RepID=E3JZU0_PUCGT|nr:uncharacterized protein PGTG_03521 [Puccinia graminis f. sp. tritici CRL 75-36-700-3]EFP77565.2 hypothetical protein PGTG_03521 [Puccinia graminis f. sp. tritici CRL 75-36-700-3]
MTNTVQSSIVNLAATLGQIGKLEFRVRDAISSVVLASNEEFEAHCIRDADEAELSLFQPASDHNHREGEEIGWASGPAVVRAQPIVDSLPDLKKLSKAHSNPGDTAVTNSYLMAIKKLLDVYPQPRLAEHVEALSRQLDTLQGSISEMQSTLNSMTNQSQSRKAPAAKKKLKTIPKIKTKKKSSNQQALEEIEDLIQHEQLEILALTDLRDEKRVELRKISEKITQAEFKANAVLSPQKLKARKTPSKTRSIMSDANDPFVLSRTESLRRSIRRIQSPHIRSELPSSGLRPAALDQGDDNNMPNTPTPKSVSQKQLERNLTQLRSRANLQSRKLQQSASPPRPTNPPAPEPSLPSSTPVDQPDPSPCETVEAPQIPESRLKTVHRLNAAFWNSATMIEPLLELCQNLKEQRQKGDSQVAYQDTIFALNRLLEAYPTSPLTPAQLIEAVLYKDLLEGLSSSSAGSTPQSLEVLSHEGEWCVALEAVKTLLVKACERFAVDASLNRTVVYFLVGKGVIRIERRASPIAICIC